MSFVTREGINIVAESLNLRPGTLKHALFNAISSRFSDQEPVEKISTDDLVAELWGRVSAARLKGKRKQLSSVKAALNRDLKNLGETANPEGLIINRDNVFAVSEARKDAILNEIGIDFGNIGQLKDIISALRQGLESMDGEGLRILGQELAKLNQELQETPTPAESQTGGGDEVEIEELELEADEEIIIASRSKEDEAELEIVEVEDEDFVEEELEEIEPEDEEYEEITVESSPEDEAEAELEIIDVDDQDLLEAGTGAEFSHPGAYGEGGRADGPTGGSSDIVGTGTAFGPGDAGIRGKIPETESAFPQADATDLEEVELLDEEEFEEVEPEDGEYEEITVDDLEAEAATEIAADAASLAGGVEEDSGYPESFEEDADLEIVELDEDEATVEISRGIETESGTESRSGNIFELLSEYLEPDDPALTTAGVILAEREEYLARVIERFIPRFIHIPAGTYRTGANGTADRLDDFHIGLYPVTNDLFAIFIRETGYLTDAETTGYGTVYQPRRRLSAIAGQRRQLIMSRGQTATRIAGASWQFPNGPEGVSAAANPDHPVVQMSPRDALAFAA